MLSWVNVIDFVLFLISLVIMLIFNFWVMFNKLFINSWLFLFVWIFFVSLLEIFIKWGWIVFNFVSDVRFFLKCLIVMW